MGAGGTRASGSCRGLVQRQLWGTSASFALRCWARSGSNGALGPSATSAKRGHGLDCELPLVPIVAGVADDEQASKCLDLQWHAPLLLLLLQSATHWSLAAVHKKTGGTAVAMYYDSLADATCRSHGTALLLHLQDRGWLSRPVTLVDAQVSPQADAWSCGHRVILAAGRIWEVLRESGALPAGIELGREDVQNFIAAGKMKREGVGIKREEGALSHASSPPLARVGRSSRSAM